MHAGYSAGVMLVLGVAMAGRNNVFTVAFGLSHERAVWWHGMAMGAAICLSLYHGLVEHLVDKQYM